MRPCPQLNSGMGISMAGPTCHSPSSRSAAAPSDNSGSSTAAQVAPTCSPVTTRRCLALDRSRLWRNACASSSSTGSGSAGRSGRRLSMYHRVSGPQSPIMVFSWARLWRAATSFELFELYDGFLLGVLGKSEGSASLKLFVQGRWVNLRAHGHGLHETWDGAVFHDEFRARGHHRNNQPRAGDRLRHERPMELGVHVGQH